MSSVSRVTSHVYKKNAHAHAGLGRAALVTNLAPQGCAALPAGGVSGSAHSPPGAVAPAPGLGPSSGAAAPAQDGPGAAAGAEAAPPAEGLEAPAERMSEAGGLEPARVRPSFSTIAASLAVRDLTGNGRACSSPPRQASAARARHRRRPSGPTSQASPARRESHHLHGRHGVRLRARPRAGRPAPATPHPRMTIGTRLRGPRSSGGPWAALVRAAGPALIDSSHVIRAAELVSFAHASYPSGHAVSGGLDPCFS
jgi:hypothetical protein